MTTRLRLRLTIACMLAGIVAVEAMCTGALAEPAGRIGHGSQIAAGLVGPAAARIEPALQHPGSTIRDGKTYPFGRQVGHGATYDGFAVSGPHLLVEAVHFTGNLDIQSSQPVVLRGVVVRPESKSHWGVLTRPGSAQVLILWCDVGAASAAGRAGAGEESAIGTGIDLRSAGASVYRTHVSRAIDGIHVSGPRTVISETLIDALAFYNGAHNDGVQLLGPVEDVAILRSRIMNPYPQTSALSLLGRRVVIEANYLAGGGYTIYGGAKGDATSGPASELRIARNVIGTDYFARGGSFGAVAYWDRSGASGNIWSANRFSTGADVQP